MTKFVQISQQDDMERPKIKVEIPALAVGTSNSTKMSKELTIKAIEAKLKALENQSDELVINQTSDSNVPLIQKYQYNKNNVGGNSNNMAIGPNRRYTNGPYNRNQRRPHKRWTKIPSQSIIFS